MIRKLVDFALENRLLVLAVAVLLFAWGVVSFHRLPVEAYPDVANNYVDVIAQWPGISAEQIEQQVTVPMEIVMNGIPGVAHVRSWSLFGLSTVEMVFGEETTNFENRERVLERLSQVTLPPNVVPQIGTDWSPVGQIYFYTLQSTNPEYDVMNVKSLEDWVVDKNLKSVPGVVDNSPFGGPRGSIRFASTPTSSSPTGSASPKWSNSSRITMPTQAAALSKPGSSRSTFARWVRSETSRISRTPSL